MLKVAVGAEFRWESLDDTPPPDFVADNAYNLSTTGVTKGSESSQEVYGELEIPVFKDDPFLKSFNITPVRPLFELFELRLQRHL